MADWQRELDMYLSNIERHTTNSLLRIKEVFNESGRGFDRKFRKHFVNVTRNRIVEACDRFEMELSRNVQPNHGRNNDMPDYRDRSPLNRQRMQSPSSGRSPEIRELELQNEYLNDVAISGLPLSEHEDLRSMFMRLCNKFDANISPSDILQIYRGSPKTMVVVRFKSRHIKEDILNIASHNMFRTDDLMRLHPDERPSPIYIGYHTTEYYTRMYAIIRQAKKSKVIHQYYITRRGFTIKRTSTSAERHFLSFSKLSDYLNGLHRSIHRRAATRNSSESDY